MSRRRPHRRWHIGDTCQVPWYCSGPPPLRGQVGGWHPGEVVAVRGERVIVRCYGRESEYPWWQVRQPPPHRGMWRRWWSHDTRTRMIGYR